MTNESTMFEKKNVLVTGGAGFIGTHLCRALLENSHVICVDNFLTSKELNIDPLLRHPDFVFLRHDLSEPLDLAQFPELEKFRVRFQGIQEIYHLACPTSPRQYQEISIETLLANSHATRTALDLAVKYQAKFLLASSGSIYGDPLDPKTPISEDYWGYVNPLGPRCAYVEGKRFAESMTVSYGRRHGVHAKIARIFHTYGPTMLMGDGRLIPDFVKAALEGTPLQIFESKEAYATFCYVKDIVDGMIAMMASQEQGPINMGSTEPVTLMEIANKIIQMIGSSSSVEIAPALPYVGFKGIPDIRRAKERLGWFPVTNLEKGLHATIEDLRASKVLTLGSTRS